MTPSPAPPRLGRPRTSAYLPFKMSSYKRGVLLGVCPEWTPIIHAGRVVFPPTVAALKLRGLVETHPGGDEGPLWRLTEAGVIECARYRLAYGRVG